MKQRKINGFLLYHLADKLEKYCWLTHWLNPLLVMMGKPHCLPTLWSYELDKKYNLNLWKNKSY